MAVDNTISLGLLIMNTKYPSAAMVELADTRDLKSLGRNLVPVRSWLAVPEFESVSFVF